MPLFNPQQYPKVGVTPTGAIDGDNQVFTTPDYFINDGQTTIRVYYNGALQREGGSYDYTLSESGGADTGWDTVTLEFTPFPGDTLTVDYWIRVG